MSSNPRRLAAKLFYSYSHKDHSHRKDMERTLSTLNRNGLINEWSDERIPPGQNIRAAIDQRLPDSDIIAFLISPDFLQSDACLSEWDCAKQLATDGGVPAPCADHRSRLRLARLPC